MHFVNTDAADLWETSTRYCRKTCPAVGSDPWNRLIFSRMPCISDNRSEFHAHNTMIHLHNQEYYDNILTKDRVSKAYYVSVRREFSCSSYFVTAEERRPRVQHFIPQSHFCKLTQLSRLGFLLLFVLVVFNWWTTLLRRSSRITTVFVFSKLGTSRSTCGL